MLGREHAMRPLARLVRRLQRAATDGTAPAFQFTCTQCGKCCTGKGGRVRVNGREREELQRALRVSAHELRTTFLTRAPPAQDREDTEGDGDAWFVRQTDDDAQCIFLEGKRCSVYQARPTQCRTFPWWPQNLISSYDWQLAARDCEGITMSPSDSGGAHTLQDVLPETIVYDIHRSGENYTYDELHEMLKDLQDVDPSFIDEYAEELRDKFHRRVVYQDESVTVLDTFLDGVVPTRCFVFNDRLHLVQSEMNLLGDGVLLDPHTLVLDVHRAMAVALSWLPSRKTNGWRVALLGSGGGSLVRHILHEHGDAVAWMDAVEPNSKVNYVAREFFGLGDTDKLQIHEAFGEAFVAQQLQDSPSREQRYDLFLIDVEAGSPGDGVLAPPLSMLTPQFLANVHELLSPVGTVVINVITEDDRALRQVASQILSALNTGATSSRQAFFVALPKNTVIYVVNGAPQLDALQSLAEASCGDDSVLLRPLRELLRGERQL